MKDYEKRQKNKKGQYKGSIHDKSKENKKHVSLASIALTLIFLYFLAMALGNRGGQ